MMVVTGEDGNQRLRFVRILCCRVGNKIIKPIKPILKLFLKPSLENNFGVSLVQCVRLI